MMCPVTGIVGWNYDVKQNIRAGAGGFGRWWSAVSGHGVMQEGPGLICVTSGRKVSSLAGHARGDEAVFHGACS